VQNYRTAKSAAWPEAARRDGKGRVSGDLGVFDRRLPPLQQATDVHCGQKPSGGLGELEKRSMALEVAARSSSLDAGRDRQGAEAAAEVQTYICLGLAPPSERPRPPIRTQE
jgi:hypothetical protein